MKRIYNIILCAALALCASSCGLKSLGFPGLGEPQNLQVNVDWSDFYKPDMRSTANPDPEWYDEENYPLQSSSLLYAVLDTDGKVVDYAVVDPYEEVEEGELIPWKAHFFPKSETDYKGKYEVIVSPELDVIDGKLAFMYQPSHPQPVEELYYEVYMYSIWYKFPIDYASLPLLEEHKNLPLNDGYASNINMGRVTCDVPPTLEEDATFEVSVPMKSRSIFDVDVACDYSNVPSPEDASIYTHQWGLFCGVVNDFDEETLAPAAPCSVASVNGYFYYYASIIDVTQSVYFYLFNDYIYYDRGRTRVVIRLCKRFDITDFCKETLTGEYMTMSVDPIFIANDEQMYMLLEDNGYKSFDEIEEPIVIMID